MPPRRALPSARYFYPRPPWGGRRRTPAGRLCSKTISIHALRGEGDNELDEGYDTIIQFLSTPSVGRATAPILADLVEKVFLSTPSVGRATKERNYGRAAGVISIHALRGEGD